MSMRLIAKYNKGEQIKYISHLDTVRCVERAFRRANIPVVFSQGFNPHPKLSFASALAVGITSDGEYMDIILKEPLDPKVFVERMNSILPKGFRIIQAKEIDNTVPALMSIIKKASYVIKIFDLKTDYETKLNQFLLQNSIVVNKQGKRDNQLIDIRNMIDQMQVITRDNEGVIIKAKVCTGSEKNLNPQLLMDAFMLFCGLKDQIKLIKIHRCDMFLCQNGKWITPMEL